MFGRSTMKPHDQVFICRWIDHRVLISIQEYFPKVMDLLPPNFQGKCYRLANNWQGMIPDSLNTKAIRYLEIGVFCGGNVYSVEKLYASHPDSLLTCLDPWLDYDDYSEYKGEQSQNYKHFLSNTETTL